MAFFRPHAAVVVGLMLAGCVSTIESRENLLAAAGFRVKLADTPDKFAGLSQLPPHKFTRRTLAGRLTYLYADPDVCKCLYYGDEAAYQRYQRIAFEQRLADQQRTTAIMLQDAAWRWRWRGWGPYWW
ncbi:hypothetical protein QNA08_09575 [Chelatococcus sp. SYSU_G07232]|uniref:Uncharacterized protein n=1 Tax=Chelatococcus albus TaxID=3047466 RepID=A0ABT7AGM3_9HYPH|nr:hypothetical protein [Chelatococcus sp. SYSU_G07232]MDJ1158483.1 hypothetical protein [Chelatococcus sp. SYSU_G07232]